MSSVTRRLFAAAAAAGVLTAGGIALASAHNGNSSPTHAKPRLSERRILQLAENAAAGNGDRRPTLIQHAEGTRHDANLVDSGEGVPGRAWSYLIAERGQFVVRNSEGVPGSAVPHGLVLTLIVNAANGQVTDFGVSNKYPDLIKLGPVHTDLRRSSRHRLVTPRRRQSDAVRYAVDIQAGYDRRGNPALGANFYPNGGLAKPRWTICAPPHVSVCMPAASQSQFIEPGHTPAGTVFRATVNFRGHRYTARSAVWMGAVQTTRRPWLQGQALAGARVNPRKALWRGGWRTVPGYAPPLGMDSGGRDPSYESLSVEACRTRAGNDCVNLTPQGTRMDFAQRPITVPARFTGWYLFAFDEHFAPETAFAEPGYSSPFVIPPLRPDATPVRSAPVGPVRR